MYYSYNVLLICYQLQCYYYIIIAKAYIVYQKEGNISEHVIKLAKLLRCGCGVNCDITSYHLNEDVTNWNDSITDHIKKAEYILLVCTKELNEKLTGQSHSRVEMTESDGPYILSSTLNYLLENNRKVLPIITEEGSRKYIPKHLQSTTFYTISLDVLCSAISANQDAKKILNDSKYKNFKSLVAMLTDQPKVEKPKVAHKSPNLTSKIFYMM